MKKLRYCLAATAVFAGGAQSGLHQLHRHQGEPRPTVRPWSLMRRLARAVRRAVHHTRRASQGRHHDARLRMGHGTLSDRHSPAARDLLDGGQHERTFAHHRRTTYGGRPELADSTGLIDYGSLIYITLYSAPARRARRSRDRRAGQHTAMRRKASRFRSSTADEAWIMELIGKGIQG